jgi:hypothetical protein
MQDPSAAGTEHLPYAVPQRYGTSLERRRIAAHTLAGFWRGAKHAFFCSPVPTLRSLCPL